MSTAIAKRETHVAHLFEEFTDDAKYNILRPSETVITPSPFHRVYANIIRFTEDDTYPVDGGKLALNRRALDRIASAAGISFVNVVRTDDGSNPDVAEISVQAVMKRPDGSLIAATGTKAIDVQTIVAQEASSAKHNNKPYNRERSTLQLRRFKVERAETGAKNRAIRQLMALKSSYQKNELSKPFVVPQITVNMDVIMQDEQLRRLAGANALTGAATIFGNGSSSFTLPMQASDMPRQSLPPQADSPDSASDAILLPPAQAIQSTPAPSREEVAIEDWKCADPIERISKIKALWQAREHGKSEKAYQAALNGDAETQAKCIVFLLSCPEREARWEPTQPQLNRLLAIAANAGYNSEVLHTLIAQRYNGISSLKDLTRDQYDELCGDEKKRVPSWLASNPRLASNPYSDPQLGGSDEDLPF